jgi:hypothetical protein
MLERIACDLAASGVGYRALPRTRRCLSGTTTLAASDERQAGW